MTVAPGSYPLGPEAGRMLIRTSRTGLGSRAGHDLTIEVTRWRGTATVDPDPAGCAVTVEADVDSLEVRHGSGGVKPLTDGDRAEIARTVREKILPTARYPTITFRSTRVDGSPEAFRIDGELTIVGQTRPVTVTGRLTGDLARGTATVTQSRWGIRPYTAFFGALKLRDEVEVEVEVTLRSGS